ncbi:MAG: ribosome maturation factor RimM, partial [Chloroflexota bacterium]
LVVALVRGVHGLRGAVRVEVLTDRPEDRFRPGIVLHREGTDVPLTIRTAEAVRDGPGWRLTFDEVTSREAADALRQAYLETVVHPVGDLSRGEVYWHEVIGSPVRGLHGAELGTVTDIYRVAENEVYVVSGEPFGTFDVPAVRPFVRIFAPRRGEIVVDADALGLEPPKARRTDADRPRAPRRTGPRRKRPTDSPLPDPGTGEPAAPTGDERTSDKPTGDEPMPPPDATR